MTKEKEELKKEDKKKTEKKEKSKLALCEEKRDEYLEVSRRLKADFENLKKDTQKEFSKIREKTTEDVLVQILPVLDSLDLALLHTPDNLKDDNWVKGMLAIKGQFEGILKMMGVEEIKAKGEEFDPNLHEAVSKENESDSVISEEIQKGYKLNDKVIRVAKVKL